jgi:molybdopterin-guanine dinucleotide biosynthesis protein A
MTAARSAAYETQTIDAYHGTGLYRTVSNTLDSLQAQNVPVSDLKQMNENLKTIDDIQRLTDELKKYPDPRSQETYVELVDFIDNRRRLQSRLGNVSGGNANIGQTASARLPAFQVYPPNDTEKQTVNMHHVAYEHLVSNVLAQLRSKKINVDDLAEINKNVNTIDDIHRLADGFKKLNDSLASQ